MQRIDGRFRTLWGLVILSEDSALFPKNCNIFFPSLFKIQIVSNIAFNGTTCRVKQFKETNEAEHWLVRKKTHYESCSFAQGGSQSFL